MRCIKCLWIHAFIILLAVVAVSAAPGVGTYWQGTTGDWFDPANWTSGVPTADDIAYISNGGTAEITTGVAEPDNLVVDGSWLPSRVVLGDGGGLLTEALAVGWAGRGNFVQTGGVSETHVFALAAYGRSSRGTYELSDGRLIVTGYAEIGIWGTGHFIQTGGRHDVSGHLDLGRKRVASGTYELSGDARLSAGYQTIGNEGKGTFIQTGAINTIQGWLEVGLEDGSDGTYKLQDGGRLTTVATRIGYRGHGQFIHTSGTHSIEGELTLGRGAVAQGTYELGHEGKLSASVEFIGRYGTGKFIQTGGKNTTGYLSINSLSRYELSGGKLEITGDGLNVEGVLDFSGGDGRIKVGDDAIVNLSGGVLGSAKSKLTVGANSLTIYAPGSHPDDTFGKFSTEGLLHEAGQVLDVHAGEGFAGRGRIDDHVVCAGTIAASPGGINLNNGLMVTSGGSVDLGLKRGTLRVNNTVSGLAGSSLSARYEYIGDTSTGSFSHTAGTNKVSTLYIGGQSGFHGTYNISGGSLEAGEVYVGLGGGGELNILNSDASITVAGGLLRFGTHSVLTAVEGSTINMNLAKFDNRSTNPAALAGMSNLKAVFQRHNRRSRNKFEVAGEDMGVSLGGFDLNFALGTLQVGSDDVRGVLQLVNSFDNQPSWGGKEALYVENLIIEGVGSSIDLNGLNLYYLNGGDLKQLFDGDSNLDGVVDIVDLTSLAANWSFLSRADKEWSQGDTNGDMLIDIVDLTALAANWGAETIVIPGGPVPEPTALVLLGLGGFALIRRRRE